MNTRLLISANCDRYAFEGGRDPDYIAGLFRATRDQFEGQAAVDFLEYSLRRLQPRAVDKKRNILTSDAVEALAFNCGSTGNTGEVITRVVMGSGTTTPALGDTGIETAIAGADYTDIWKVLTRNFLILGYHWTGTLRDAEIGASWTEVVWRTTNNGATKSSDKAICRAVFDRAETVAATTDFVLVHNLQAQWAPVNGEQGLDQGLTYFLSRLDNLSTNGKLNRFKFGSGAAKVDPWATDLATLTHSETTGYTATGATLTASGTLSAGGGAGASVLEAGPAADSGGTLYQMRGPDIAGDNVANDVAYSCTITFANVVTADRRITHTGDFRVTHTPDNRIVAELA